MFLLKSAKLLLEETYMVYNYFHLCHNRLMHDSLFNKAAFPLNFHTADVVIFLRFQLSCHVLKEAFQIILTKMSIPVILCIYFYS